MVEGMHLTMTL